MKIKCYCNNDVELIVEECYHLTPDVMEEIEQGTFLNITCDSCSNILKPEVQMKFKTDEGTYIVFFPENERYSNIFKSAEDDLNESSMVIGYPELVEYVTLYKKGLSREAIEIAKLHIIQKVDDPFRTVILLNAVDDGHMTFHIHGIKDNEVGVIHIPLAVHDKIVQDLPDLKKEEPYASILKKPYISLRRHIESEAE